MRTDGGNQRARRKRTPGLPCPVDAIVEEEYTRIQQMTKKVDKTGKDKMRSMALK
jgi:hypothetical protein